MSWLQIPWVTFALLLGAFTIYVLFRIGSAAYFRSLREHNAKLRQQKGSKDGF